MKYRNIQGEFEFCSGPMLCLLNFEKKKRENLSFRYLSFEGIDIILEAD